MADRQMYHYQAYGLTIAVPFECPSMTAAPADALPDITVVEGPVPRCLPKPVVNAPMFDADAGEFLVRGGMRAARFLVAGGDRVTFAPNPDAEEPMLAVRFTTMVLPAVLRQRGLLVLHANSTVTEHGALAIAGDSGAGKSTTLAGLLAGGARMLSDDVTALQLDSDGAVVQALPGVAELHLSEASTSGLAMDVTGLHRQTWRRMKTAVPTTDRMASEPAALTVLYVLSIGDGREVRAEEQFGGAKFAALSGCVYGPVQAFEGPSMFALFAAVLEQTAVIRVVRPAGTWSVDAVLDTILRRKPAGATT